jgi:hypothetical protein
MNSSLLEMVLAIALSGLILASAVIPTTQALMKYEAAQLDLRNMEAHALVLTRAEQLTGAIWRDANGPTGTGALAVGETGAWSVGWWAMRVNGDRLEQRFQSGTWGLLASPVQSVSAQFMLDTGVWTSNPPSDSVGEIIAMRFGWTAADSKQPHGGAYVTPDHALNHRLLWLAAPDHSKPYQRSDYACQIKLTVGAW